MKTRRRYADGDKKKKHKRLKHTGNLFKKNLQLKGVC